MAFDNSKLTLLAHGNDNKLFFYDEDTDSLATVNTAGYINTSDDNVRLTAGDQIIAKCSDATATLAVSSVAAGGDVTTKVSDVASVHADEAGTTSTNLSAVGRSGLESTTGALTYNIDAPFGGAFKVIVNETTRAHVVEASTGTYDGTNNTMTFAAAQAAVILSGRSTTRWDIAGIYPSSTYIALS